MTAKPSPLVAGLRDNIVLRLVAYYLLLAVLAAALWWLLPSTAANRLHEALGSLLGKSGVPATFSTPDPSVTTLDPRAVLLMSAIASVCAVALSVPVAWVYMFTRAKKGYQQSVVHTLIMLPVVIAMVATLVRSSIALAFSLAGIVAAVRFRTTLDDSKDAVYVFAVMAVGLASGAQLEVAAVTSVLFVSVTLTLGYTDFGRTPPALEGERAQKHMERALALANRTSQFVARLDREILDSMAPAQLEALQARLDRHKAKLGSVTEERATEEHSTAGAGDEGPRFDGRLMVTVGDTDQAQPAVEAIFDARLKRWKLIRIEQKDGHSRMVYAVRSKKGSSLESIAETVEREGAPFVARVEAERWA